MSGFGESGEFTKVKGVSSKRRMPRLGKIRLGAKAKKGETEYPIELPFFLVPDEVAVKYGLGEKALSRAAELGVTRKDVLKFIESNGHRLAEELPVMLPMDKQEAIFPQSYRLYGSSRGAKCIGDGEKAKEMEYDESGKPTGRIDKECPCSKLDEPRGCSLKGFLMVMLPEINPGGIYQISVGSYNSVVDVNSGIEYAKELIGRAAMVPMKLRRVPTITHGSGHEETHFTLQLLLNIPENMLENARANNNVIITRAQMLALPEPEDIAPEFDDGEVIEIEPEPQKATQEAISEGEACPNIGSGDVKLIEALLNTLKVPKDEFDRVSYVCETLGISTEEVLNLSHLTQNEGKRLLDILKKRTQGGKDE